MALRDERTKFFFWLGVLALPVFWSWFTLARSFSRRERFAAFAWLAITLGLLAADWAAVQEFGALVVYGYTIFFGLLTMGLWLWLVFRIGYRPTLIEVLGLFLIFGGTHPSLLLQANVGHPFSWGWMLPPLILSILHLLVDPTKALFLKWRWIRPL